MPGIKGKRVAGRPGRFDPTIPLHMTTRRKAAKTAPEMDLYGDDEYDDADSRRTSLDEISVTTPYSEFDSEPPAKRQRTADPSPQQSTTSVLDPEDHAISINKASSGLFNLRNDVANEFQSSSGDGFARPMNIDASQTSVQSRTENSSNRDQDQAASTEAHTTEGGSERNDPAAGSAEIQADEPQQRYESTKGADIEDNAVDAYSRYDPTVADQEVNTSFQSGIEGDWEEAENPQLSTQESEERDASVESSRSDVPAVRDLPLPEVSTDATPMATRQGSPATTASAAAEELTPARSKPADTLELMGTDDDDEEEEEGDDVEPATEIQDTMENLDEEDVDATRYQEDYEEDDAPTRKQTKRRYAGGRRRAAHQNAYVEAALRRQLELKQFYRQVTRSMKACLGELAQITIDELETDQQHHKQVSEYEAVMAELDEQLARRKQQLVKAQKFNHDQLLQRYDAESDSRRNLCRIDLEDIKEQQLVNLEYNMLQVNRAKLRDEAKPGHETEDEDGVIPRPKGMAYRFKRSKALDLRYDSRSRLAMETELRVDDLQRRTKMWEALKAYDPEVVEAFTVMDSAAREAAEERRRNVDMTKKLAEIAAEYDRYDRLYNAPVPPQAPPPPTAEELAPLNALAELAATPNLPSQRPKGRHLPSSSIGPFAHHNQARGPLHSSPFERSTAAPSNQHYQNSFLRLAMEQSRGPSHPFAASPISALLSPSLRKPEEGSTPSSGAMSRTDGNAPLAAKPALHERVGDERDQSVSRFLNGSFLDPPHHHLNSDRASLLARERAREVSERPDQANRHSMTPGSTGYPENKAESARQAFPGPPHLAAARSGDNEIKSEHGNDFWRREPSRSDDYPAWKGSSTNPSDRESHSRRGSRTRASTSTRTSNRPKRYRDPDPEEEARNQRPRASTASLARQRSRSASVDEPPKQEEELRAGLPSMSPRGRRLPGFRDDELSARRVSDHDRFPPSNGTRRLSAQSNLGEHRPSDGLGGQHPSRRSSEMLPPPIGQQGPGRPMPPFPPPFMPQSTWANSPFFPQQPMPAPTAQPINHFANAQGGFGASSWATPFQPAGNPPPPPPPFRDMFGRR